MKSVKKNTAIKSSKLPVVFPMETVSDFWLLPVKQARRYSALTVDSLIVATNYVDHYRTPEPQQEPRLTLSVPMYFPPGRS